MKQKFLVIGAGMAGLTVACQLKTAGYDVDIFEKENEPGGRAGRDVNKTGIVTRRGAEFLIDSYTNTKQLANSVALSSIPMGSGNISIKQSNGDYVYINRSSPIHLILSPIIKGKLLIKATMGFAKLLFDSLTGVGLSNLTNDSSETYLNTEDYCRKNFGNEIYEEFINPIGYAPFRYDPKNFSAKFFISMVKEIALYGGMRYKTFPGELYQLPLKLGAELPVTYSVVVTGIKRLPNSVQVDYLRNNKRESAVYDKVVIAVPGDAVLVLLQEPLEYEKKFFKQVKYGSALEVFYALPELPMSYAFKNNSMYVLLPKNSNPAICALTLNTRTGKNIVEVGFRHEFIHNQLDSLTNEEINQIVEEEVGEILPNRQLINIRRWHSALPMYPTGYMSQVNDFLAKNEKDTLISYCGDYLYGPYVEGAVRSGNRCAKILLKRLEPAEKQKAQ